MKIDLRFWIRTAILAALALAFQALGLNQMVTGPAVNTVLYVASLYISPFSGVLVGLVTPWVALAVGIMKFAPAVPVIMLGNATLAISSGYLSRINRFLGLFAGACAKFLAMTAGMKFLVARGTRVPAAVYTSLTVTQLFTALGGALVAAVILEVLERMAKRGHGGTAS